LSSWDTSTGLAEKFTIDVGEAWFGTNDKYQSGKVLLLNFKGPMTVDGDEVDPEYHMWYSCGQNWKAAQGGASAVNTTGSDSFNENTGIGRLIDSIKALGDDEIAIMRGRGESFEAETWGNLSLDLEREHVSSFKNDEGEEVKVYVNLAVGLREGGESAKATPAASDTDKEVKAVLAPVLRKLLLVEAKKHDSNDDFMGHVLDNGYKHADGLAENEEILDEVIDGTLFAEAN
jgi:hypothetical protein